MDLHSVLQDAQLSEFRIISKWLELGNDSKSGGYLFRADECVLKYNGISIPPSFQQESDQVSENSRVWLRDYDTIVSSP